LLSTKITFDCLYRYEPMFIAAISWKLFEKVSEPCDRLIVNTLFSIGRRQVDHQAFAREGHPGIPHGRVASSGRPTMVIPDMPAV